MKKKISICAVLMLLIIFSNVNAQDAKPAASAPESKGFIGIYGGYSLLSGNITNHTDFMDLTQGFANTGGPIFSLDGAYFFNKNIGVGLVVSMSSYGYNDPDSILSKGYVDAFSVDEVTMTFGRYKMLNILPAFYYTIPSNKLNIDFRLMVGYSSLTTAKISIQLEDQVDNLVVQDASTGGGLAFGIGAGLRYSFSSHLGAALRIDYINAKPKVDVTYTNLVTPQPGLWRDLTKYNESISNINSSLGIFYSF